MRKKTIKYNIVDLVSTRYVVLRLADLDALICAHHYLATELTPQLTDDQWKNCKSALFVIQQIRIDRIPHCKVAILSKNDYDSLNLAIAHLQTLLMTTTLDSITIGPSEADQPSTKQQQ